jgi:adhesin transport system membrane fusion protein
MASKDVNFVHSLYEQANMNTSKKIDFLFISILLFFVCGIIWASLSYVDELARGEGKVIPSEKIQTLQSLDGGIISKILVKEGEFVKAGQALMSIDRTRFQASLDENKEAYYGFLTSKIRLESEYNLNVKSKIPKLKFSKLLSKNASILISNETNLYKARVNDFKSSVLILENQLGQKVQEIVELKSKSRQLKESEKLIREEFAAVLELSKSGAKSKFELLKIKKELSIIKGDLSATNATLPKAQYAIKEAKNRIIEKIRNFKSEALIELQKVNSEIKKYESILVSESDKLDKTIIKSPVDGFIKQLNINTIGGVVQSGMDLIEIVPQSDILLVEVKIDPKDIAFISPELKAIVKLTAYDFSIYGALEGQIVEISADSIQDKESKEQKSYYRVVIKTNKNYLERNGKKLPIIPGMIASVDIVTGNKTIMDFLLKPILKTKQDSLHER